MKDEEKVRDILVWAKRVAKLEKRKKKGQYWVGAIETLEYILENPKKGP